MESNKKLVFFDADGTLISIPYMKDHDRKGKEVEDYWFIANAKKNAYSVCKPFKCMQKLIKEYIEAGVEVFLLSRETSPNAFINKKKFIAEGYPGCFDDDHMLYTATDADKIKILKIYAEVYNIPYENIEIWDDTLSIVLAASHAGFTAHHISEMLE